VRAAVVNNPKISLGILEKLAVDEIWHVRQAVAENPQIYVNSTIEMLVEK
jgi:predicted regulator of amino acid metabolism with ACT domain